jgi:hypothetical protein
MSHYVTDGKGLLVSMGLKRTVVTLCGITLDKAYTVDNRKKADCAECRRRNGE